MIKKYYSEKTKKDYKSEAECIAAEKEWYRAHAAEMAERESAQKDAEEIKKAYEELEKARKHYSELVNKFVKEHKNYHLTISSPDFFDSFFDSFWHF